MNGLHAVIEANGKIAHFSADALATLMESAATAAGATVLQTCIHRFGEGCGFTGVVLLAESHISVHTWPENDYAAFDIFICGETHIARAIDTLKDACPNDQFYTKIIARGRTAVANFFPEKIAASMLADIPLLAERLSANTTIAAGRVIEGLTEVIKYLWLCANSQETLAPSSQVASLWQELILFTKTYEQFCQRYLSRYIHHQPLPSVQEKTVHYQTTLEKYLEAFGLPNTQFWPESEYGKTEYGKTEFGKTQHDKTLLTKASLNSDELEKTP